MGAEITLVFTVRDNSVLPANVPSVTINSLTQTATSVVDVGTDGKAKTFTYKYTVPTAATHDSTIGYSVSTVDAAGNTVSATSALADLITIGKCLLNNMLISRAYSAFVHRLLLLRRCA